jgi:hypothetical protein
MSCPESRLAWFVRRLRERNRPIKTASIDFTDPKPLINITIDNPGSGYDLVLLACEGLNGFSIVRHWHDFDGHAIDYSDEDVIAEYETDEDISKV